MRLRLATYNIHGFVGRDGVEEPDRVVEVLREMNCDIVALQEVRCRNAEEAASLYAFANSIQADLIEGITLQHPDSWYGNAVLTRIPALKVRKSDVSISGREPRGVIEVELMVENRSVVFWSTHLGLAAGERKKQIDRVATLVGSMKADVKILAGDFNEWLGWGRTLRPLYKTFQPLWSRPTFPSRLPVFSLDRIWIQPQDHLISLTPHATPLSRRASDHLPLVAEIEITG